MSDITSVVRACCVCPSIERRGVWYDLGQELYNKCMYAFPDRFSHTYCPPDYIKEKEKLLRYRRMREERVIDEIIDVMVED